MDLIATRRQLHAIPELALHEYQTSAFLMQQIQDWNSPWITTKAVPDLPTAVLVRVAGKKGYKTIGYRADIDALPITEATNLPFTSTHEGVMHACGHDFHMTIGLGVLDYFAHHQPDDHMIFLFQPAEESESGGQRILDSGVLADDWKPDEFYGLHINPTLPTGTIATRQGTLFAGTTEIHLRIVGKGGHAAYPHTTHDAIVAASYFVTAIQTIVSRNVDPIRGGVVTIGTLQAGTIGNVIAGEAKLDGTIRALRQVDIEMMQRRVRELAAGLETMFNVKTELLLFQGGYKPVENNANITADFMSYMETHYPSHFQEIDSAMTGEDFGTILQKFPGTMFWLGVGDRNHGLHDAGLTPDEAALPEAVTMIISYLEHRMEE